MTNWFSIGMICIVFAANLVRFLWIDIAPPDFYLDEAAGATQVMCLKEGGLDFYGNSPSLFTKGFPGFGLYTPIYVYGEMLWTSIFGNSVNAFRSFIALTTAITVFFLYLLVRNLANERVAIYTAFFASISPWAFQFSRIAWDPPIAVLFLIMGVWATTLDNRRWLYGLFLALAAYSYPPVRITVIGLGLLLPGLTVRERLKAGGLFLILTLPIILKLGDADFMARSAATLIWGNFPGNPYSNYSIIELLPIIFSQFLSFFSFDFLFIHGDKVLRHSIQSYGMLSWVDGITWIVAICALSFTAFKKGKVLHGFLNTRLTIISVIGIIFSILPSALTHDGNPNALRAIAAWPFFALLSGVSVDAIWRMYPNLRIEKIFAALGLVFFAFYLHAYFYLYPALAKDWFATEHKKITFSYLRMSNEGMSCSDARKEPDPRSPVNNPPVPNVGERIDFGANGSGKNYLQYHWYQQEEWGVWSSHGSAQVVIPLGNLKVQGIVIEAKGFPGLNLKIQKIEVFVNDVFKGAYELSPNKELIYMSLANQEIHGPLRLKFKILYPNSPKAMGLNSEDDRKIGLGLVGITLKE